MKGDLHQVLIQPLLTEKITALREQSNTVGFLVHPDANKIQIKAAVEAQFNVTVEEVNVVVQQGKKARSIRLGNRRARPIIGVRKNIKKAYVRLKDGDNIKIFEEEEKK